MRTLNFRCNGGDIFRLLETPDGSVRGCPFDGWGTPELAVALQVMKTLGEENVTIAALRHAGLSEQLISRALIIDFGSNESVFDGVSPGYLFADGKVISFSEAGLSFL